MSRETYETEGPKCPYCDRQYTADDPVYYDETQYVEEVCDDCGKTFDVSVCTSHDLDLHCPRTLMIPDAEIAEMAGRLTKAQREALSHKTQANAPTAGQE